MAAVARLHESVAHALLVDREPTPHAVEELIRQPHLHVAARVTDGRGAYDFTSAYPAEKSRSCPRESIT